jgi:hypothetical protein
MDQLPESVRTALENDQVIDITTTGCRSGRPSRIEIWFLNLAGTIYIMGSPGRRDWFANLRANPEFVFHLKDSFEADLPATAEVIDDPDLRQQVFAAAVATWDIDADTFDESTKRAPLVRVRFTDPPS